jgi:hypothetical protein
MFKGEDWPTSPSASSRASLRRIFAEVFANALVRKQHEEILVQKEMKYRTVADFTYDWEHWTRLDGTMEYVSPSCDIPLLTLFFVEKTSKRMGKPIAHIPAGVVKSLQAYSWPGNVRELENVIQRAVINSSGPKLRLADDLAGPGHQEVPTEMPTGQKSLRAIEKAHIIRVLEETNWRLSGPKGAAVILDNNPSTLRSRMQKLGIKKP